MHGMAVDVGAYTSLSPWWALTKCGGGDERGRWSQLLVMVEGKIVVTVFGNVYESNCQTHNGQANSDQTNTQIRVVATILIITYRQVPAPRFICSQVKIWNGITLLAWCDVYTISFLPRAIFHSLPSAMFMLSHSCPGLYVIPCLDWCLCYFIPAQGYISFLA